MVLQMRRVAKVDKAGGAGKRLNIRTPGTGGARRELPEVELATSRNDPLESFESHALWLYSQPGVGKTSLSAEFPNCHQFFFEPGGDYVSSFQKPVSHWLEWVAYKEAFLKSDFSFAVVDGMRDAFDLCFEFMCQEVLKIEHPTDEKDYGKSWNAIYTEFVRQFVDIIKARRGLIMNSHAVEAQFKPQFDAPYNTIRPSLSSKPLERLMANVTVLGYLYHDPSRGENVLRIRDNGSILAKCRPTNLFLYKDGTPIEEIPMGTSAAESFRRYKAAFHNEMAPPPKQTPKQGLLLKKRS